MKDIYIIRNTVNNKVYVGQTNNIKNRMYKHFSEARNKSDNMPIHEAMRELGMDKFYYEILESNAKDPDERECYWISLLNSLVPYGYNKTIGGTDVVAGSGYDNINAKFTPEDIYNITNDLMYSGMSVSAIAKKYNCAVATMMAINNGQTYHNPNLRYPLQKSNRYDRELIKQIKYSLKYEYDKSLSDIANEYNVDLSQISEINQGRVHQYPNEVYPLRSGNVKHWMDQNIVNQVIYDLQNSLELNMSDIARKYNISRMQVRNINIGFHFRQPDITYPIRNDVNASYSIKTIPIPIIRDIEEQLAYENDSIRTIADEYNLSVNQIQAINNGAIIRYRDPNKFYPIRDKRKIYNSPKPVSTIDA